MVRVFKHPKDPIISILYKNRVETFTAWDNRGKRYLDYFKEDEYPDQLRMVKGGGLHEIHFPRKMKSIVCVCKDWSTTDMARERGWRENDYGKNCKCAVESMDYDESEVEVEEVISR